MSVIELKVPAVGESVTEVTLSDWLVEDGSYVEMDQIICEFVSDKATLEFPSTDSGKITFVAQEGQDLKIGETIAEVDTSVSAGAQAEEKKDEPVEETVEKKAIEETEEKADASTGTESEESQGESGDIASPAAAKLMRENSIETSAIQGSGKDGRITKGDVLSYLENGDAANSEEGPETSTKKSDSKVAPEKSSGKASSEKSSDEPQVSAVPFSRETSRKKMSRIRRTIAKRLVGVKNETAMLTTFNEVDLTEVMALRKRYQEQFVKKNGIKLGFMSLFAKACAKALLEFPDVNAILDGEELIYHDYVDISIAISTETGLVVPPVKNVESKSFAQIEKDIDDLATKARSNKLTIEEMTGGTFTITNGGIFGSLMSTPILNNPQSAILGMHNILQRPVAVDGEVVIKPMMYLALSYDHRVIDGSTSVTFLVRVKNLLEDPITLMMEDL